MNICNMPSPQDNIPLSDPFLDRRIKLLPCQKEMIVYWHAIANMSIVWIASRFNVSRRQVEFILFPERLEQNKAAREEKGGWELYYNKSAHRESVKKTPEV